MMIKKAYLLIYIIFIIISIPFILATKDLMALQGNVQQAGVNLASGNLSVKIYDSYAAGNLVYDSGTDFNNNITNGKYDVMLGNASVELDLEYGKVYYMEIYVNGEPFTFGGKTRQVFQSSFGNINGSDIDAKGINQTHLAASIDLSNATNIQTYAVNKSTGTNFLNQFLDSIIDQIVDRISSVNSTANIQQLAFPTSAIANNTYVKIGSANQTIVDITNVTNFLYNYNQTTADAITSAIANASYTQIGSANQTYVDITNITNFLYNYNQTSPALSSFSAIANTTYLNFTPRGTVDFNGGWQVGGFTIQGGDIFAQTAYFVNISGLRVTNLAINGSLFPYSLFDSEFDVGNISMRWRDLFLGGNAQINGTLDVNERTLYVNSGDGNVGVGTGTPYQKLDVQGNINVSNDVYVMNGTSVALWAYNQTTVGAVTSAIANGTYLMNDTNANFTNLNVSGRLVITGTSGILAKIRGTSGVPILRFDSALVGNYYDIEANRDSLDFQVSDTVLLSLNDSSNMVGIGTSAPAAKLHLTGGDNSGGFTTASLALGWTTTGQYPQFIHTRHNTAASNNAIDFYTSNGTANGLFPGDAVYAMTITNGKVGIGNFTPIADLDIRSLSHDVNFTLGYDNVDYFKMTYKGTGENLVFNASSSTAGDYIFDSGDAAVLC
ncbi:MAG: hypothetical protein M1308_14140, partial [Actinobacteria bacterium]|nr:hypothetical protein [Actinomycetota bacterium]